LQDDLKAEAQEMGQSYLSDPSYQEATQMSFADLFKKVCLGGGPLGKASQDRAMTAVARMLEAGLVRDPWIT
jgi:hypothetical protein